jgi:hypothetical protein
MSTSQAFMPVSVTVGNYLVAFGNGNGGGSYTISDSQHNTWTLLEGGGGGNSYGMWVTTASATGEEDVTIVGGASPSLEVWEIANTAGVDVHNSAETATIGGSISASITTTHTNDYVLEIQSTQSGCNTGGATYSTDSGFTWLSWTASHCSFGQGYEGVAPTTATFTSGASSGPGLMSVGVIAMKPAVAGVTSTQPVVNVIQ